MHQWLYDYRFLVLLLCLPAMGWSSFLYIRAWRTWQDSKQKPLRRRRSAAASKAKLDASKQGGSIQDKGPLPRTTSIKGEQADLLNDIDQKSTVGGDQAHRQKSYQSTHIIKQPEGGLAPPRDTGPRPSEIIRQLQERGADQSILDQVEAAQDKADPSREVPDEEDVPSEEFSTTDKFRTTRHLQAVHEAGAALDPDLTADIEEAAEAAGVDVPTWLAEQEALREVEREPPPGLTPAEQEAWRKDQQGLKALADESRRTSEPFPAEPGADKAIHRGYKPPEQAAISAMEKAKRLEELGLHFGIESKAPENPVLDEEAQRENSAIAEDLSPEQRQRLSDLGLAEADSEDDTGNNRRLVTEELDGILARLDAALDEDENLVDEPIADAGKDEVAESVNAALDEVLGEDDALDEASADSEDEDSEREASADSEDEDSEREASVSLDSQLDQVLGEDEDDMTSETQAANTKPASELPSWARVDTFDEDHPEDGEDDKDDQDDGEPKQQSLFE